MIGSTVLIMSLAWSVPPTIPVPKARTVPAREMVPANRAVPRIAQAPPKVAEPTAAPLVGQPPQPLPPPPPSPDPFEAPRLPASEALVPTPPQLDAGYHAPIVVHPEAVAPAPAVVAGPGFTDAVAVDGGIPCYGCPSDDDDDGCCLCGPDCPCDLYPHYAYFPKYHGHYYFRPYNYTTVFQQQQWATCAGMDPRNPYSNKIFECAMAGFEQVYRVGSAPIGTALPTGSGLPQLEELVGP